MSRAVSRKFVYALLMILLVWCAVEALATAVYRVQTGSFPSPSSMQAERAALMRAPEDRMRREEDTGPIPGYQVIHPYLGYVNEPNPGLVDRGGANRYGFPGPAPRFGPGGDDTSRYTAAVLGGSMAQRLAAAAPDTLAEALQREGCLAGREIDVVSLALPGMKQPQQLMTLNYFLSLGARLDLVISLDGFNEVVLPVAENEAHGVFPFYPRSWQYQVANVSDVRLMNRIGEIEFWRRMRRSLAGLGSAPILRSSLASNVVWWQVDRGVDSTIHSLQIDLALAGDGGPSKERSYLAHGPRRGYRSDEERYSDLVGVWARSTRLMFELSEAEGIAFFHFLQPNQRVPDSKNFTPAERAIALPARHAYDAPARAGYPRLIEAVADLRSAGVPSSDLTGIFRGVEEALYVDGCCHVNEAGSRRIAEAIASAVRARLSDQGRCGGDDAAETPPVVTSPRPASSRASRPSADAAGSPPGGDESSP